VASVNGNLHISQSKHFYIAIHREFVTVIFTAVGEDVMTFAADAVPASAASVYGFLKRRLKTHLFGLWDHST